MTSPNPYVKAQAAQAWSILSHGLLQYHCNQANIIYPPPFPQTVFRDSLEGPLTGL